MPATLPARPASDSAPTSSAGTPHLLAERRARHEPSLDARVGAWADRYRVIVGWCAPSADMSELVSQWA